MLPPCIYGDCLEKYGKHVERGEVFLGIYINSNLYIFTDPNCI